MIAYIARRMLYAIPILIGVNVITFLLFFTVNTPDDMARMQLGLKRVTPEAIAKWKQERGYDKPVVFNTVAPGFKEKLTHTIFFEKSLRMFVLDFGAADDGRDIAREIGTRMWPSLAVALPVFVVGLLVYITLALVVAFFRATYIDFWGVVTCVAMMSISTMFYIIGGQYLVSKLWHLVPISGYQGGIDAVKFLVLPVAIGIIGSLGGATRLYRTFFLEEMSKDYVRTARAKGLVGRRGAVAARAEERHDPDPHWSGGGDPAALHGQPDNGVLLRHTRPWQLHHRRDPLAGLCHRSVDGLHRISSLHRRIVADGCLVHAGGSEGSL